jgi:hypothetical protein
LNIMAQRRFHFAIIAGVLLAAGCRGNGDSDPVPASLPGTYAYIAKVGWTSELFLKGIGAPNVVLVKQSRS